MGKPMKAASSMKKPMKEPMKKPMKSKKVSKIARGKRAKSQVLKGRKEKTASGLKASDLMKNNRGKIVSRKKAAVGAKQPWYKAVLQARKALNLSGFHAVNGKTAEGKALYEKAKAIIAGQ